MMRAKNVYAITVLLIFALFTNQTWAADWGFRGLLPRGTGYYDKNGIKKVNKNITQVWTVTIYNEKGKADAFSLLKKQDKAPDNPEILSQELVLLEFDCVNEKYRIASMDIYDEKENLLLSIPEVDEKWHDIIPNSINEKLKNTVCSAGENYNKEKK
jgi:hypothetical protein